LLPRLLLRLFCQRQRLWPITRTSEKTGRDHGIPGMMMPSRSTQMLSAERPRMKQRSIALELWRDAEQHRARLRICQRRNTLLLRRAKLLIWTKRNSVTLKHAPSAATDFASREARGWTLLTSLPS